MPSAGVSGLAVGLTTTGGIFVVAAIRNQSPIDVVKEVLKKPTSGGQLGTPFTSVGSGVAKVVASSGAAVGEAAASAASSGASGGGTLVAEARRHLGAKYVFGATGPTVFDCSGLVVYSLRKTLIPNCKRFYTGNVSSYLKSKGWQRVSPSQFQAGDIIIRSGHMGIAVSNSRMIHAPHAGTVVKEASIYNKGSWWGYRPPSGSSAKANQNANRTLS
jgi:cell wall-associated NlpC family hydrolase